MKRIFAILAVLFASLPAMATTIGLTTVTATGSFSLNVGDVLTIRAQIAGCGNAAVPYYNNLPISLTPNQTYAAPFTANSSQVATFVLPGNDKIICANQNYTTYVFTWMDNGFPIAPSVSYRLVDNTTINLNTQTPVNFVPPVIGNAAGASCSPLTPILLGFSAQYVPVCAAAVANLSAALPITGGTLQGSLTVQGNLNLTGTYLLSSYAAQFELINGIPQADQFTGADACAKLAAAISYAAANNLQYIDATHFTGVQTCSSTSLVNPFSTLSGNYNLRIDFGSALFQIYKPWDISASGINLQGKGAQSTQIEYVGTGTQTDIVSFNNAEFDRMDGFFIFNGPTTVPSGPATGQATNAILINLAHRSEFSHLSLWGTTYGLQTTGAVTDTFFKDHSSNVDATYLGLPNFGVAGYQYTSPNIGFFFQNSGGVQTTNGTVIDIAAEGNQVWGVQITSAQNMTFTGGTAEFNGGPSCTSGTCGGVLAQSGARYNTWIGADFESNGVFSGAGGGGTYTGGYTGADFYDQGQQNAWVNGIFGSTCSSCSSIAASGGARGQSILQGTAGALTGFTVGDFLVIGVNSYFPGSGTLTAGALTVQSSVSNGATQAPYFIGSSSAASFTPGTGITSVTCADPAASGTSCNSTRGTIKIINSTATTSQLLATITFGTTLPAKGVCSVTQVQGSAYYGLYVVTDNTTGLNIQNANTVSGSGTFYVTYRCDL